MELVITEKLIVLEILEEKLRSNIFMVLTVKLNLVDPDDPFPNWKLKKYFEDCGIRIKYVSQALHLNGEHKVPHYHYHFILYPFNFKTIALHSKQHLLIPLAGFVHQ